MQTEKKNNHVLGSIKNPNGLSRFHHINVIREICSKCNKQSLHLKQDIATLHCMPLQNQAFSGSVSLFRVPNCQVMPTTVVPTCQRDVCLTTETLVPQEHSVFIERSLTTINIRFLSTSKLLIKRKFNCCCTWQAILCYDKLWELQLFCTRSFCLLRDLLTSQPHTEKLRYLKLVKKKLVCSSTAAMNSSYSLKVFVHCMHHLNCVVHNLW